MHLWGRQSVVVPATAGTSSVNYLPANENLNVAPILALGGWLTIGTANNGALSYSVTANTTGALRSTSIFLLGRAILVNQTAQASQTITFGSLSDQPLGTAPFAVSATASSGLAVSFASLTESVCTVSGSTVSVVSPGTCTIQATQAGNGSYAAATAVSQSFQVVAGSADHYFWGACESGAGRGGFHARGDGQFRSAGEL